MCLDSCPSAGVGVGVGTLFQLESVRGPARELPSVLDGAAMASRIAEIEIRPVESAIRRVEAPRELFRCLCIYFGGLGSRHAHRGAKRASSLRQRVSNVARFCKRRSHVTEDDRIVILRGLVAHQLRIRAARRIELVLSNIGDPGR